MPFLRQTLDELRRYHRLLMVGGRWAAVLVMTFALVFEATYLVQTHIADEAQTFAIAHRLVRGRINANEHSFLNGVVRAELSWDDERAAPHALIEQFRANGNLLRWKPFASERLEVLIAGAPHAAPADATLERAFAFATQVGRANVSTSRVLGRSITQVFFNADRSVVAIMPSSDVAHPERLATVEGRADFTRELTDGTEKLAFDAPSELLGTAPKAYWVPRLYALPTGRKVLQLASPVMSAGKVEAVLVSEIDPDDLLWPIAGGTHDGMFAVVSDSGEIVATASQRAPGRAELDFVSNWRRGHRLDAGSVTAYRTGGRFVLAQPLGDSGFSLVYTYSWRDVAAAIQARALAAAAIALTGLAVIWLLLYQLNRRVFLPMYARSEQVFESERLSRTVIETVPVGIGLVSTGSGELLYGGSSLLALSDLLDGGMPRLLGELSKRHARLQSAHGGESDEVFQEDVALPTRDGGEIALQARFARGRYLGEDVLVTAFVDMTASKQLQQRLRDAKRAADQANAAKSTFLATMSHEIRTPLNAILGNLELLAHSSLNPLQRDRLRTIRASSNGLLAIIQDVLDFSKIEAGEMQFEHIPFNVADVMTRALVMFAPVAQAKGVALYGTFGSSIDQRMRGDPARLAQVVHNLLSNAIKFTADGKVTLTIGYDVPLDGPQTGAMLVVSVADTGIGIGDAQREHLFKAFAQADSSISRRFGGTGLGLALCQRLTAGMSGTIGFDGEAGVGSCFTVRVPLDRLDPARARVVPDARIFAGQRVTLLAAADEWHACAVPLMTSWGMEVEAAHHPDEIVETSGRLLVIYGDRSGWSAQSENRHVEDCAAVVNCSVDGPLQPMRVGRVLTVSCHAPAGLRAALDHVLNGKSLASPAASRPNGDAAASDAQPARRLGLHVLVAEDNEVNQRLLQEQLSMLDCSVQIVADGVEALQMLSDQRFDVVLTDLNMPRMDGYVLARIMRERWPRTPIVAVTADATVDEHRRCTELGIRAVLSKPLSLGGLARILTQIADRADTAGAQQGDADDGDAPLGDRAIPPAVVDAFRRSCAKSLDALRKALTCGDAPAMLAELHSLKGALGVFQQRELGLRCVRLEQQIRTYGLVGAGDALQVLADALAGLLEPRNGK